MATTDPDFPTPEYLARLERTRAEMEKRGLDLLVCVDPSNMHWLTGYDGWSFYVHQAVILGMEGEPVWWGRAMDALGAMRTVFMSDEAIAGYDDSYVQNPEKHPMSILGQLIEGRFPNARRIGVELDNYYYSAAAHAALQEALPNCRFFDQVGLVNWQRTCKSPEEMVYIRRAARIVEAMHQRIVEVAEPGMPKNVLVAEIFKQGIAGADGEWGDYPAIMPMAPSGMDATAPHLTWDGTPLTSGVPTFFEIAGVHRRYHAPQARTLFLGEVPDKYLAAEEAVLEATEVALRMARPGNRAEDVANAFNMTLNARGFMKEGRVGYAVGLSYPPDWGERTISFRPGDQAILQPGMVFHFMPALWLDDGGIEITEPILITEDGVECLCSTPAKLFVK
ncbi:M24 family metallopeptidase [Roseicyclus sp. F158]|uniref:M24 family metallopeptidase n=1 Tax=Tropicimonas omnivorans TaxID=3075590 RepID=A0ABU3DED0_9RHOB|nr:M24 family metallopeptidase [Roseicyclus sp. F158]MDT0682035.1 M24 family metallopeptidase [Roseicyclus sp. F158]